MHSSTNLLSKLPRPLVRSTSEYRAASAWQDAKSRRHWVKLVPSWYQYLAHPPSMQAESNSNPVRIDLILRLLQVLIFIFLLVGVPVHQIDMPGRQIGVTTPGKGADYRGFTARCQ
jgi:hypothetical protein